MDILSLVASAIVGFIIGIFVYRNNTKVMDPIASKMDEKYEELESLIDRKIRELKTDLKNKDNTGL